MNIFAVGAPLSIFRGTGCFGTQTSLAFHRATITQTSAGDTVQSFALFGPFVGDLQPEEAGLVRMAHGQVFKVDYHFYVQGNPDIRTADRCEVSGERLEVVSVRRYGTEHAEIDLLYMGR